MKRLCLFFIILICALTTQVINTKGGILYTLSGGRLGDNILAYARAAFLAHIHHMPLYYTPFPYSDQLVLESILPKIPSPLTYKYAIRINNGCLNNVQYEKWYNICYWWDTQGLYEAMVTDSSFAKKVKFHICPKKDVPRLILPNDRITVAVHVRKGGGKWDDYRQVSPMQFYTQADVIKAEQQSTRRREYSDELWPMKFPPDQYYVDQIKWLSEFLEDQPLHVHIFTDDPDPQKLVKQYKKHLNKSNISFSYRESGNDYDAYVLEDFFTMAQQFDCLIRSGSNFGWATQFIGNHKIIIAEESAHWTGNILVVDKVSLTIRQGNTYTRYFFPGADENEVRAHVGDLFDRKGTVL